MSVTVGTRVLQTHFQKSHLHAAAHSREYSLDLCSSFASAAINFYCAAYQVCKLTLTFHARAVTYACASVSQSFNVKSLDVLQTKQEGRALLPCLMRAPKTSGPRGTKGCSRAADEGSSGDQLLPRPLLPSAAGGSVKYGHEGGCQGPRQQPRQPTPVLSTSTPPFTYCHCCLTSSKLSAPMPSSEQPKTSQYCQNLQSYKLMNLQKHYMTSNPTFTLLPSMGDALAPQS